MQQNMKNKLFSAKMNAKYSNIIKEYCLIVIFSVLYSVGLTFFVFPHNTMLGGTGGLSVIISAIFGSSPAFIMLIINLSLLVLAFILLGKSMGVKTLVGTILVAVLCAVLERFCVKIMPLIKSPWISSALGSVIVATSSAGLFSLSASSGGTDIIALIINKYKNIKLGKALFITDILIVIIGGIVLGVVIALISATSFMIKVVLIDLLIKTKSYEEIK